MRKTPQEVKRENVKILFEKILKIHSIRLTPYDISVKESWDRDFTAVKMDIEESVGGVKTHRKMKSEKARGFVDGMFKACYTKYVKEHGSLQNIRLIDYQVKPQFNKAKKTMGSDAKTEVTIMVEVKDHGIAEFSCTSRSILYSSFVATLEAFQFYINCDKTFKKIKLVLDDANARNRADLAQICMSEMSLLTGVNTYEQKRV